MQEINASQAIAPNLLLNTPPAVTLGYTQPGQNADASAVLCPPLNPVVAGLAAHSTRGDGPGVEVHEGWSCTLISARCALASMITAHCTSLLSCACPRRCPCITARSHSNASLFLARDMPAARPAACLCLLANGFAGIQQGPQQVGAWSTEHKAPQHDVPETLGGAHACSHWSHTRDQQVSVSGSASSNTAAACSPVLHAACLFKSTSLGCMMKQLECSTLAQVVNS